MIDLKQIIYKGRIRGKFDGFNRDKIFKMDNGTFWVQSRYRYWYGYYYRPEAMITLEDGEYLLHVAGETIPVRRVYNVQESNIVGEFQGWDGEKKYKLMNGQVWQQAEYKYEYTYSYQPEVIIADIMGRNIMYVEGTQVEVRRIE